VKRSEELQKKAELYKSGLFGTGCDSEIKIKHFLGVEYGIKNV
jgi:hypothetical protein